VLVGNRFGPARVNGRAGAGHAQEDGVPSSPEERAAPGRFRAQALVEPGDEAAPLRVLSHVYRRGVVVTRIEALSFEECGFAAGAALRHGVIGRVVVEFTTTASQAEVVVAGLRAMPYLTDVRLSPLEDDPGDGQVNHHDPLAVAGSTGLRG